MDVFWHALQAVENILLQCLKAALTILRSTEFISALGGALGGAFFGAFLAARFESRRRRDEKRDREYEAFLRTQAVIISQGNSLAWIAKLYPSDDSFDTFQTIVLGPTRQMLDFENLAFVAKSSDPQLLIELDVANETYDFFRRLLESRNDTVEEFLRHPATRITKFDPNTGQFSAEGPQQLLFQVRQTNSAARKSLADAKHANETTIRRLVKFAQKEFPGRRVLYAHENASSSTPAPPVTGT
jgi:hypothetical protein